LGGKPLLLHVLDALSQVDSLTGIAVSSDDPEILALAGSHPKVQTLGPRDPDLSGDRATFMDLARRDSPRFAEFFGDKDILFVTATAALVSPEYYARAVSMHRENPDGLTLGVRGYEVSPMLALTGAAEEALSPLFPDKYRLPTKDLPPAYADAGCFYAFDIRRAEGLEMFLDMKPVRGVLLPPGMGIDVDTPADFERLEIAYRLRSKTP
jgi:CMP-N-acetylneuraminic acid synthetase